MDAFRKTALAAGLLGLTMPVLAQNAWTIPGTVNASGLNGTKFVSDVAITNPGTAPAIAILTLVPANGTAQSVQLLSPGQTLVFKNVLQQLWGASGAAATVVDSTAPLLIRARTYNNAASGTYGVALPVVSDDAFLDSTTPADSLWVSQSADPKAGYRTNIAVVFPDPSGGDATVTVYDASGNVAGTQLYSLAAGGFQQFSVGAFAGAVDVARARIAVTRGRAAAYSVVVDNVTGDSSLFSFESLPAGRQDVVVNGVARANGRNATFFRTDARLYNPTDTDASVTVAFHANQTSNPSPATATFTLPAGKILDVVDVLQTLLGLPVGSAGALRFASDAPVAILCRTSNVDPTGVKPGTYGAQQKPVPILSFLMSADAGAVVTGVRQGADFRTNVGFAAGADGASYSLTLKTSAGAVAATTSGALGAWGWTQPNVQDLFPGVTVPADATLEVNVTAGSADVFDSSIDNASGDPVVTPIMPLPVSIPSSASIGPAGGSVQSDDGRLLLRIPAGALASPTTISIGTTADTAPNALGPAYSVTPGDLSLSKPALVTFNYGPGDVNGSAPDLLIPVLLGASGSWYGIPGWTVDTARQRLTAALPFPAPAAVRAARTTLAGRPVVVEMSTLLSLSGDDLVPPNQTASYTVQGVKGPSPYKSTWDVVSDDVDLKSVSYTWAVNNEPGGGTVLGTVGENSGQSAVYQAPACPPFSAGVVLSAAFKVNGVEKGATKAVLIFPDQWYVKVTETIDATCVGKTPVRFSTSGAAKQIFKIDHKTAKATALDLQTFDPTLTNANVCGFETCTITTTKAPNALTLNSFSGRVSPGGYLYPTFGYRHVGEPSFSWACQGHTGSFGGEGGKNEPVNEKTPVPWQGMDVPGKPVVVNGFAHSTVFSVFPIPIPNCH